MRALYARFISCYYFWLAASFSAVLFATLSSCVPFGPGSSRGAPGAALVPNAWSYIHRVSAHSGDDP